MTPTKKDRDELARIISDNSFRDQEMQDDVRMADIIIASGWTKYAAPDWVYATVTVVFLVAIGMIAGWVIGQ